MKRIALVLLLLPALCSVARAQSSLGLLYHEVQVVDENGRPVTDISEVYIYLPGTTTNAVIYKSAGASNAITVPLTTSSTNTTLVNGKFHWWGQDTYNFRIGNGSVTASNSLTQAYNSSIHTITFPYFLKVMSSTSYADDASITLGTDSDFTIQASTTGQLDIRPATTDESSTIKFGANTEGVNFFIYPATSGDYLTYNASGSGYLGLEDSPLSLGDGTKILFGDALGTGDLYLESTTNVLTLGQVVAGTGTFGVGVDGKGIDTKFYGETASSYMLWDQDGATNGALLINAASVNLADGDKLYFGSPLGTGDFSISDESDVLSFRQVVADTGTVVWGADNAGIDQTWYGESASAYMKYDATGADQLQIVGVDSSGTLLALTSADTTGDSDTVTITHNSGGDGIQITVAATDGTAVNAVSAANQTTSLVKVDGATGNWIGADNIGALSVTGDTAGAHTGASLVYVANSAQPIDNAEGFLARFVDTGAARTTAHAVEIETANTTPALGLNNQLTITGADSTGTLLAITGVDTTGNSDTVTIAQSGTGAALQITDTTATAEAIHLIAAANQTTNVMRIDGATGNWIGANDVGMLTLIGDTAGTHTGTSLLNVQNSAQPIAAAEGFLARFVDTGTARTDAYAVEIETTNTTPALKLNNQLTIAGADSAGTLFDITAIDTTGNTDTMTIAHSGTGSGLKITCTEADSVAESLVAAASQTTSVLKVDGATGSWLGAANVGMVHLTNDGALANVASSLLYINNTGVPTNDSRGSSLRIVDTGNAAAGTAGYAVYISATDATVEALYVDDGNVLVDDYIRSASGVQSSQVTVAADIEATQVTIPAGTRFALLTSDGATKVVCLPNATAGDMIEIYCAATGCELQTLATSNATINTVDCDGANELAIAAGKVYHLVCVATNTWIAYARAADGAAEATLVPDADA